MRIKVCARTPSSPNTGQWGPNSFVPGSQSLWGLGSVLGFRVGVRVRVRVRVKVWVTIGQWGPNSFVPGSQSLWGLGCVRVRVRV